MNIFKKLLGEDSYENDEFEEGRSIGYEDASDSSDSYNKPKPQFVLVKPDKRDDLLAIADHLMGRKTVILNLELVTSDVRRFVDFLSGVAYALNGQVKKVAVHTFLIIPGGLEISGDIFEDIENEISY